MTRLPRLRAKQLIQALEKGGFVVVRIRGSHARLHHPDGRITTVPSHSGETIGPGLLRSILRDIEMSVEDLAALLDR
jgi:predicted RNA binding protein YcfA (HicA-like mRNA interferase family)